MSANPVDCSNDKSLKASPIFNFFKFFEVNVASTIGEIQDVMKLRHDVFCQELGYEEIKSSGVESDDFDNLSRHCYVRHKRTGQLAGALRIILPNENGGRMAVERFESIFTSKELEPGAFTRSSIGEVSRAVVPEKFRRRGSFAEDSMGDQIVKFSKDEENTFSMIAISLYLSAMTMLQHNDRQHAFILMENRLARGIRMIGINSEKIGNDIEFRGTRAPFYVDVNNLKYTLKPEYLKFSQIIERGFHLNLLENEGGALSVA